MWPFSRDFPSPDQINIPNNWTLSEGDYRGKPLITRFNTGFKNLVGHTKFPYQGGIAVPFKSPDQNGFPTKAEENDLEQIECILFPAMQEKNISLMVGIITTNGMREFVFYTQDPEEVKKRFEKMRAEISTHEIQLMIRTDKSWDTYKQFT